MSELLILEGEPMVGRILEHKLRREGYAVTWLRAAATPTPESDIALVEVDLGGDSRAWIAGGAGPRVGWFAICDHDDDAGAQRAVRAGAAGVIRKPFKPTVVAAQVRTLLEVAG
jgi:DNA-binding response OmpR family regulator